AIPLFLYRTGSPPAATHAGVRSMLAPWAGGAGAKPATAATRGGARSLLALWMGGAAALPAIVLPPSVGSSISGGTFTRGRWRKLVGEWEAQQALAQRARETKRKRERKALAAAARAAREA